MCTQTPTNVLLCMFTMMVSVQDEAVEHVASTMQQLMSEEVNHRRLYLIQTYGIGKERVFIEVCLGS